jgi:hypothetical protein
MGDTFQFVRYLPLVKVRGGRVIFECPSALTRLVETCGAIDQIVAPGDLAPACDVQAPLLSLPYILKTTIPASVPYVRAPAAAIERWRPEVACESALNVGIVWQGNPQFPSDRTRSIPLAHFAKLASVPGVRLLSLQVGPAAQQLATAGFPVSDLGSRFDPHCFADAAGALMNLDLLISSDTAAPHLAGALGVPVWVALGKIPDWRWLLDREDSPWYPTMRLFRQREEGDWAGVFERMASALTTENKH